MINKDNEKTLQPTKNKKFDITTILLSLCGVAGGIILTRREEKKKRNT